ncbi:hypothetical protein SK128_004623, partial [Halocaridina rubra]
KENLCEEGATYKQDCNDCVCRDGVFVCTQRACLPDWYENRPGSIPDGFQCSPGSRWMAECNWCTCSENGIGICTEKACLPGFQPNPNEVTCEEGSTWKPDECNRCRCINGKQACSTRQCGPSGSPVPDRDIQVPEAECRGDGRWRHECNWCRCRDGRGTCTRRGCPPALIDRLAGEPECEGRIAFKKDCNTCTCIDGHAVCTEKFCGPVQAPTNVQRPVVRPAVHSASTAMEPTCTSGSRWRDECNWCHCSENGMGVCTLMGCLPGGSYDEPECEGNARWKKDCNWCNCVNGKGVCTKRTCLPRDLRGRTPDLRTGAVREPTCTAGSRWREGCNWCTCSETKLGICTVKACLPGAEEDNSEPECEGDSRWKKDCNWCNCIDGKGVCTKRACIPRPSPGVVPVLHAPTRHEPSCTAGSSWRDDCNWCSCSDTGVGMCTMKGCIPGMDQNDENEPECLGNSRWKKDCNWCNCIDGRGVCTKRACIPVNRQTPSTGISLHRPALSPGLEPSCTEGSRWRIDCNWCSCTETGVGVCTEKACISDAPIDEPDCEGDSSWKRDCNWCKCVEGKGICTKKACIPDLDVPQDVPLIPEEEPQCTEGSRWKIECNWCHCTEAGVGICTKLGCNPGSIPSPDERQCEDGSRWKQDCNWCHCANGQQLCTQIACAVSGEIGQPCTEGERWNDGCNSCMCSNGRAICTQRACFNFDAPSQCTEGDSWMEECNNCRCSNGLRLCTKRLCTQPSSHSHCLLPPVDPTVPKCAGFLQKWTFDSATNKCKQILYGGCGATQNLFSSNSECQASCMRLAVQQMSVPKAKRCLLEKDSGPCFAAKTKYYYKKETGTCESFVYGGCGGNRNRFRTLKDCQETCGDIAPAADVACDKSQCPWMHWGHYESKGCLPQYEDGYCCPTSFSCPSKEEASLSVDKCFYKNKAYGIGDRINVDHECSASCVCVRSSTPTGTAEINCATIECPSLFRPNPPGCRSLYRAGECCSYDTECADPQNPAAIRSPPVCSWKDKNYLEGDKMYFDEHPCQKCICSRNFTDPFGSGCSRIDCGLDFRYTSRYEQGSVPIYFENRCCPIDWLSPGDRRIVESELPYEEANGTENQCHLGSKSFNVATKLELTNRRIDCRCLTPPELTCVQYRSEEAASEHQANKNCPEVTCGAECTEVIDAQTECISCSCQNKTFTCPKPNCLESCKQTINYETGCLRCQCDCPVGPPPCPMDCAVRTVTDDVTGCSRCECDPRFSGTPLGHPHTPGGPNDGNCHIGLDGRAPCPVDCAVERYLDESGCEVCRCNPNNPGNPFGRPSPSVPRSDCRTGPDGRAPCPMDCAIERVIDESGCEVCRCKLNNPGNPFGRPPLPNSDDSCRKGPDGRAPCPMDCIVERFLDDKGCEVCRCDPSKNSPLEGRPVPPRPNDTCRKGPDGRAPCPFDCAIERYIDDSGCEVCRCDPTKPGNPFGPPPPPPPRDNCRKGPDGRAPCPMDCAIERIIDETGCEICRCHPTNPGNPFVHH